jgi:AraC-like DNA-binding protein
VINIPIVFLFSFALSLLLVWILVHHNRRIGLLPKLTLALIAIQSVLVGLRWTYGIHDFLLIQATLATLIPPLVLLSMRQMASAQAAREPIERIMLYLIPSVLVFAAALLKLQLVDWIITSVFAGFGLALIYLGVATDTKWQDRVRFEGVVTSSRAFVIAGCALLVSALVDVLISFDEASTNGIYAARIVGLANLSILLCLALGVLLVNRNANLEDLPDTAEPMLMLVPNYPENGEIDHKLRQELAELLKVMDAAIIKRQLYRDPNLSLDRLARKLLIPTRQISLAVNTQRAINVSQYINLFRVMEAAFLLKTTDCSVTEVIYDVGFNTKSNFNREFKRIVGISPSDWRKGLENDDTTPMRSFYNEISDEVAWEPAQRLFAIP